MLAVSSAVAKVLLVLRQGKEAQLAEIKRHVSLEKDFLVHKCNILIPAAALKLALLQYEEELLQTSTKPATMPAAPAASSSAEEEVAAPSSPAKRPRVSVPQDCRFRLNEGAAELQIYRGRALDIEPQFKMCCKSCNATCSRAIYKASLGHLLMWAHLPCEGDFAKHNGWKMCNKMLPHDKRQDWLTWAESHLRDAWGEQQRLRLDDRQDEPMELKL